MSKAEDAYEFHFWFAGGFLKTVGVIPARFGSTRFPGKPLVSILGKPLLQWVVEGAKKSKSISEIAVATDDKRIMELCEQMKVKGVMTPS